MSATSLESLAVLAGGYALPWRQPLWVTWSQTSRRADGTWLAGAVVVLLAFALLPLSFLCMAILTTAAVATCLRALALHQYTQRLSELSAQQQAGAGGGDADAGAAGGSAAGLSSAQRRARRPSLLTAVAAAGRPFNLLHLRLSLVERDFTEPGDYELLLRLDELEAGAAQSQQPAPPLPEDQLALLPVHVHRTPTKKARKQRGSPFEGGVLSPRAAPWQPPTSALRPTGTCGPPPSVPVLQEWPEDGWTLSAAPPAPAPAPAEGGSSGATSARPPRGAPKPPGSRAQQPGAGEEIAPASPQPASPQPASESEEDEEILCSVCLEPFDDGAKILSLPCRHQYHEECVKTWLRYKGIEATCPNCKSEVFVPEAPAAA